ncbi:thioesterase II family protein [Streptomyces sp. CB01580]|uniref:thioesterase II family protein n=1 Tax=Streptomyces sp. CB01580 TaxID=1703933 RepID=UPI000938D5AF|nr:alpha/beta fold hydrolase [Streptomyces sp. CB01580]OKJ27977.1 thioesterase [Streptomyces sp. CB01580]
MQPITVITLPFAGAGAAFYRSWTAVARHIEILPLQLPGREELFVEPPHVDACEAAADLLPRVTEATPRGGRLALYGHSLGAVLAFELAHRLVEEGRSEVVRLIVSGSPAPWAGRRDRASGLPDDEFLCQVRKFAGYDHPALDSPALRELLLPTLRADVEMHESYVSPPDRTPLPVPITAIRGDRDELVSAAEVAQWREATSRGFRQMETEGGHMYLAGAADHCVQLLEAELATVEDGGACV